MGWSIGFDTTWHRDIGYGVPAYCDFPGCGAIIDRGLSHVCGGEPYGGTRGCGLYFCEKHLSHYSPDFKTQLCQRCARHLQSFDPTPDHPMWIQHKLKDRTWKEWRDEKPDEVKEMRAQLKANP
jgi:hypothetical protein